MSVASDGIWFPIATNQQSNHSHHRDDQINAPPADSRQPIINPHETSSGKPVASRQPSADPGYWSPIGTRTKADMVDGYTQMVRPGFEPVGHVIWSPSCSLSFPVHDRRSSVT